MMISLLGWEKIDVIRVLKHLADMLNIRNITFTLFFFENVGNKVAIYMQYVYL